MSIVTDKSPSRARFAITERKKSELDALSLAVLEAQHQVDQYQAIVTALSSKQSNFQAFLAAADGNRTTALSNKNLVEQLVQSSLDLKTSSDTSFNEMVLADSRVKDLAGQVKKVMDKLIYTADTINKLSGLVIRKKAMNPLIIDELVKAITQAGTDANNAVALTLVALKSGFSSEAANMESEAAVTLEYTQAMSLYQVITGIDEDAPAGTKPAKDSIQALLEKAYKDAKEQYKKLLAANHNVTRQLNDASASLQKAQVNLTSLQLGLLAGNAAALAS